MTALDAAHAWAIRQPLLRAFTLGVRVLLALAFVPSGLVKILDQPFTQLPVTDPVGAFFAGFFTAHGYYRFIGVAQWVAAACLLFPRTATLGAWLYLPIIVNIWAITMAIGPAFGGTRVVTGAMLLAALYLLAWDWDRWRDVVRRPADPARHGSAATAWLLLVAAMVGGAGVTGLHLFRLGRGGAGRGMALVVAGSVIGLVGLWRAVRDTAPKPCTERNPAAGSQNE